MLRPAHLACAAVLLAAGCGAAKASAPTSAPVPAVTATSSAAPSAPAPLQQGFAAFFAGCENGDVPPAGIFVTCDPADGSDTAPAAGAAACARVAYDLGALAPAVSGTPLGVENGPFPSPASGLESGSVGRQLRCTFGSAVRVDLAAAPARSVLGGTVTGPAGARCSGRVSPSPEVTCVLGSGAAFELVTAAAAPAAALSTALGALAADPV